MLSTVVVAVRKVLLPRGALHYYYENIAAGKSTTLKYYIEAEHHIVGEYYIKAEHYNGREHCIKAEHYIETLH